MQIFIWHALPFNLVKSSLFVLMMKMVGQYGRGLKHSSYHKARVTFLKKKNRWTNTKQRSLTNFLINSPSGTIFLKFINTSSIIKDAYKFFEFLDSLMEEIGEDNVVQVVTYNALAYVSTEKKYILVPFDLILHDIGNLPIFKEIIQKNKQYSKKKKLKKVGLTRFATFFLTLKSFEDNKFLLQAMLTSQEWANGHFLL
ncbi:protein of unknown function DUF659 - like 3 [Theobroma cacao]|nr:protein of unknown function DUF659 - like 3 [Theobroma cacao]